jgi:hypothetical protein
VKKLRPPPKSAAVEQSYAARGDAGSEVSRPEPVAGPAPVQPTAELLSIVQPDAGAAPGATPPDVPATAAAVQSLPVGAIAAESATAPNADRRRRGGWFPALAAVVAVLGAAVALAAPSLRPALDAQATKWLGPGNPVSELVAPAPVVTAPPEPVVTQAMLSSSLVDYDARIKALHAAVDRTASLSATVTELSQRAERLRSANAVLEARARAGGVLALAVSLRRGIDAGVPIGQECAALRAAGPFPAAVDQALAQVTAIADRVPTMRDLADGFDVVQSRAATGSEGSVWTGLRNAMGFGEPSADEIVLQRLRALAMAGRFSEAATALETSPMAGLGTEWVAMVRARTTAVVGTQVILNYALQGTATAFSAASGATVRDTPW